MSDQNGRPDPEIVRSLGGILCNCPVPIPIAPAGMCPKCGAEGPFHQQALLEHAAQGSRSIQSGSSEMLPVPFSCYSLIDLLEKGVPAPVLLCKMLYEGGLHSIAGAPDSGKTTIALWWGLQLLREGGRVMFFDEEGGPEIVTEKFSALGATPIEMRYLTYVPFPGRSWLPSDLMALRELTEKHQPQMVLWDSSAAFLARAGLDENQAGDVTGFWSRVLTPLARESNAAVVVIDHDTKSTEASRYARGSGAKLAAIDVQFKIEIMTPFSRDQNGMLKLLITKDRRGYLHRNWQVRMDTSNAQICPQFYHETSDSFMDAWTPARRKVYGALSREEKTNEDIRSIIRENFPDEKPMTRETASRELNELHRSGYAGRLGQEHIGYRWTKAFRGGVTVT